LHLVYGKFEQLWYHKSRLKERLNLIGSKWCLNLLHSQYLIYYDYNIHNLIIHKYFLGSTKLIFLINISSTCSPFYKIEHFVQIEIILCIVFNSTFRMGFSNILNVKWNIIIMLIIVQFFKKTSIHQKSSWIHVIFFYMEQWAIYFTLLALRDLFKCMQPFLKINPLPHNTWSRQW
jgi:hypothetical protein